VVKAFYNEIDAYCCDWLSNLMDAGEITPGKIDERPIQEISPDDLRGYDRAHFFAGVGGWDIALRLAKWPDDRPVWTGSCPCQPFSAAGAGKAADDERHLWPAWFSLIAELRPPVIFGEQVEAAIGWGWLDLVCADLEAEDYACAPVVLPACSVGAPHIRQRLWFVADAPDERHERGGHARRRGNGSAHNGATGRVADSDRRGRSLVSPPRPHGQWQPGHDADGCGDDGGLDDAAGARRGRALERAEGSPWDEAWLRVSGEGRRLGGFWSNAEWILCSDGRARPVEPGIEPLAHGVQRRTSKLRAYGNAIPPQVAAGVIAAFMEVKDGS
jgi:DNA (cytosine-5)-methyltransferase 1